MKRSYLPVVIFLCAAGAFAQVPNGGFENWTSVNPDLWATSNAPPVYTNVTKSSTAHSGSNAARGEVVPLGQLAVQPVLQSGTGGHGFGVTVRHAAVTGWYQLNSIGGDVMACNFQMFKGGIGMGSAATLIGAASSWTQFTVPFIYFGVGNPDTCILQIQIVPGSGSQPHAGSWILVDDLAFSGINAASDELAPVEFTLEQNYPNPFNPSTVVSGQWPVASDVRLVVYDMLGREVARVANGRFPAGRHSFTFDAAGLAGGMYLCRLTASPAEAGAQGSFVRTIKMTLIR